VRRVRRCAAPVAVLAVATALVVGACGDDGRELRDPAFPLPPTTTTSTTLPFDMRPGGTVSVSVPPP
jgi:hypothetical protein